MACQGGDPFTPMLRAYEADKVQVRVLVGAHEEGHNFKHPRPEVALSSAAIRIRVTAIRSDGHLRALRVRAAGYRSDQGQHAVRRLPVSARQVQWITSGTERWGLLRAYRGAAGLQPDLQLLPNNPTGQAKAAVNNKDFQGACPWAAPSRKFSVTAVTAQECAAGRTLVYNTARIRAA
jgi:hypothetical protein